VGRGPGVCERDGRVQQRGGRARDERRGRRAVRQRRAGEVVESVQR
jgi:hypothetical protein